MKYLKRTNKWRNRIFSWICCLTMVLGLMPAINCGTVYAATRSTTKPYTVVPVGPMVQELRLSNPSAIIPGGRGYMVPQQVCVVTGLTNYDTSVIGVPVTFEVSSSNYLASVMRGYNKKTITVYSDSNGMASAANTYAKYLGEGFQVYSNYRGYQETLQVKASIPGVAPIIFYVNVTTY